MGRGHTFSTVDSTGQCAPLINDAVSKQHNASTFQAVSIKFKPDSVGEFHNCCTGDELVAGHLQPTLTHSQSHYFLLTLQLMPLPLLQVWMIDGQPRILDKIAGRRKKKRSYEYEVKWQGLSSIAFNRWIPREVLEEKGFEKILNQFDGAKAAAAVGQDARPLTQSSIESYLADFGLDPEFGTHSFIRGLSGGQKVKLVLAAAMWLNPQVCT